MQIARLFWSGRSQAVRLPKAFRFEGREVRIRRHGQSVVLEPLTEDWAWLDAVAGEADEDFAAMVAEGSPAQTRPELDDVFR
jgi:antitoxin VapB